MYSHNFHVLVEDDKMCQGVDTSTVFTCSRAMRIRFSSLAMWLWRARRAASSSCMVSSHGFARACGCCAGFITLRDSEFECFQQLM
jgi:hypothetical protein